MAELLFGAMSPSQDKSRPTIRLPPMPVKAFRHETQIPTHQFNDNSSPTRAYTNHHGGPTPLADTETWQGRFQRLTGKTIVQQQNLPNPIRYDAFDDPIKTAESSSSITSSSTMADAIHPDEHAYDQQVSTSSTPPSTMPETPIASVSSQTAALLMEGAKANWKNICEALLVGVSPDDREILEQITMLVERLGTGSGPLSLAHRPYFAPHEMTAAVNVGTATVCTRSLVEEEASGLMTKEAATQQAKEEEEASKGKEEEKELQARRERIATSLLMRRQEQPIMK